MKLIYKGKYNGNVDSLPCREHMPGAVKFKEPENMTKLAIIANVIAGFVLVILLVISGLRCGEFVFDFWGIAASLLTLFPHEILHAICFKEEVYLYTNFKSGMLFVVGNESMSKGRFVFMSLLPNLIFGLIPYFIFLLFPQYVLLGTLGMFAISMGAGDYMNVYHALTQMPKGAKTYLYKMNSYWFMPEGSENN